MGGIEMARMEISAEQIELGAQMGAPDALFELGMLYATGRDVAADLVVAHKWFNLAAARGNPTRAAIGSSWPAKCRLTRSPRRRGSPASGCRPTRWQAASMADLSGQRSSEFAAAIAE